MSARGLGVPLLLAVAAYLLWSTPVVWPLKIFVVFLHELSHGLAALVTGGSIQRIELSPAEGGLCVTAGGSRFLVLSAGYLGSLLWGALLLVAAVRSRRDRTMVAAIGLVVLAVTLLWVRTLFGFVWGLLAGAALLLVARYLPDAASDLVLKTLGVVSVLYAVWDIGSDTLARSVPSSDASALARLTGIPGVVWGVLWVALSVAVILLALRAAGRAKA